MNGESLLIFLLIDTLAGWLGGIVVKGYGLGPDRRHGQNVGVIGSFPGGCGCSWAISTSFHGARASWANLVGATVGAIVLPGSPCASCGAPA